jgi:hypothetical protein
MDRESEGQELPSAQLIREGIIGIDKCFKTPFGKRKVSERAIVLVKLPASS